MITPGLVSVSFREMSPRAIVALVLDAGLLSIEWGGDIHAPHGDVDTAKEVGRLTRDAGLEVAAYGSYYRTAVSEGDGLNFTGVLDAATALGAPLIRVWAGNRNPADADKRYREKVIADTRRIADLAAKAGIGISFEFHGGSLTETHDSTLSLLKAVDRPNVLTYWQAPLGHPSRQRAESLQAVLPHLANIHVHHFSMDDGRLQFLPLSEGKAEWVRDLGVVASAAGHHHALIEFVQDNDPASFLRDAATLRDWLTHLPGDH